MRRTRASSTTLIVAAAFVLSTAPAALGQTVTPAAPRPVPVTPIPVIMPTVVSPTPLPSLCAPDSSGKITTCPPLPAPLTPTPVPSRSLAPTPMIAPSPGLAPTFGGGIAAIGTERVLSYFQRGVTHVDTAKAFGLVLMPKSAVSAKEKDVQARFCLIMLASLEFSTPDAAARRDALVTYWPIVASRSPFEVQAAFEARDCDALIAWYDHNVARSVAARAGIAALSGPLLITWPSAAAAASGGHRDPLIVDFAKADDIRARKALSYWFGELQTKPDLWTNRIREGTIRAELADAINDTAGVVLAMLAGKWDSVTAVGQAP